MYARVKAGHCGGLIQFKRGFVLTASWVDIPIGQLAAVEARHRWGEVDLADDPKQFEADLKAKVEAEQKTKAEAEAAKAEAEKKTAEADAEDAKTKAVRGYKRR